MEWLIGKNTDLSDEEYTNVYYSLSPSRKAHIDKMKKEDARKRSLMATFLINQLLLKAGKCELEILTDQKGKPYLNDSNLFISISHSDIYVACVLSETPVGIDIEKIRPVSQKLIEYVCTENEKKYVLGKDTDQNEITKRFFSVWTAKEACFKKGDSGENSIRFIDTLSLKRQEFLIDGYYVTIL